MLRCLIHIKELYLKNIQHDFTMIERIIMVAFIPNNPLGRDAFVGAAFSRDRSCSEWRGNHG
jgi:hypothetical protein